MPGETLAADALANALAQVFVAERRPGRTAVAMSGGVDSAVALLRAAPNALGVTLRLWLDPDGPDTERACCSPDAVIAARETCHALGLPHVTLDLRQAFRGAVVAPFVQAYARGDTPNPCARCNGSFRFRELLAFAATGRRRQARDRPLRPDRRAPRANPARSRCGRRQGSVLHARDARSRRCSTGLRSRSASRTRRRRAPRLPQRGSPSPSAGRARRRASWPAGTTATSSSATAGSPTRRVQSSTRTGARSAGTTGSGASPRGSAAVWESPARSRSTRSAPTGRRTRS